MASNQENPNNEWEEINMLMEMPNGANLNVTRQDLFLQAAGLWSDEPVIKIDDMLYVGEISKTMGSHLFVECTKGDVTTSNSGTKGEEDDTRQTFVTDTYMKLEPIYLERKAGMPPDASSDQRSKDATCQK